MFAKLSNVLKFRDDSAYLLARGDDLLLNDIGLTRAGLESLELSRAQRADESRLFALLSFPQVRTLPVAA